MTLNQTQVELICLDVIFITIAGIAIAFRFKARKIKKASLQADDWTIVAAYIFLLANNITNFFSEASEIEGKGKLITELTPKQSVESNKFLYVGVLLSLCNIGLAKISIVLFYKRIFAVPWFVKLAYFAVAIIALWTISSFLSLMFASTPISDFWKELKTTIDFQTLILVINIFDIVFDVMILSLPIPIIMGLKMSTKRKVAVFVLISFGVFCTVIAVVRLVYSVQLNQDFGTPGFVVEHARKATDVSNKNILWGRIENFASIITACLPTIAPLLKDHQWIPSIFSYKFSEWSRSRGSGGGSNGIAGGISHFVRNNRTAAATESREDGQELLDV